LASRLPRIVIALIGVLLCVPISEMASGREALPSSVPRQSIGAAPRAADHLARIRQDPPALRAFLRAFPKGADLHTHLAGAIYAESYIQWAAGLPLCIDLSTLAFVAAPVGSPVTCRDPVTQRPAAQILLDPVLYRRVIDAFSTRHWHAGRSVGHYQFFDTFPKFGAVFREGQDTSPALMGRAVAEVMHRAALQNVLHLELMLSFDALTEVASTGVSWESDEHFQVLRERILATVDFKQRVVERRRWLEAIEAEARAALGCATPAAMRGCGISVRFVAYAFRGLPPPEVFAQAMLAFELAAADSRIVGVNLVMPEDWYIPMRDYDLHMRMFRFLRTLYPGVNVALHAGELALGLVPPEKLGLHIRQAIEVGGAQRIGHGTDIMNDVDPTGLLREMARRRIPVEISLSSSDVILGVRAERHPLRQYLRAGVPVVIATDDEGVARSDLTNEYQRAVEEHGVSYAQLKEISRNSIEYSFLPAAEKARLRQGLEAALERFESGFVDRPRK
jgi:adenosine deaminase